MTTDREALAAIIGRAATIGDALLVAPLLAEAIADAIINAGWEPTTGDDGLLARATRDRDYAMDERDAAVRILDDHRVAVNDATTRLERIAEAHGKEVDEHGGVSGFCGECDHVWPCPTHRWATAPTVDINCTWDLDDCEFEHDHAALDGTR